MSTREDLIIPKGVHYTTQETSAVSGAKSLREGSIPKLSRCALLLGGHKREAHKLASFCTTSCPTLMLKGVRGEDSVGERVHDGD